MNEIRHAAGAKQAGKSMGGKFAPTESTEATGSGLLHGGAHPDPNDPTTTAERDQAVDFTSRDAEIRSLWNESDAESRDRAANLSAALIRDTIKWRYEGADHILISEFDGRNQFLAEVRAADGSIIAFDASVGAIDESSKSHWGANMIDVSDPEFLDDIWPHIDGLPRVGQNAPFRIPKTRGGFDSYRFDLDPVSGNRARLTSCYEQTEADWAQAADQYAWELQGEDGFEGKRHEHIVPEVMADQAKYRKYLEPRLPEIVDQNAVIRAFEAGVSHPLDARIEADFDDQSRNESNGRPMNPRSYIALHEDFRQAQQMRQDMLDGKLAPKDIVGSGYRHTKQAALEYLNRREALAKRAIATRGRALVAQGWYSAGVLRKAREEAIGERPAP